MQIIDCNVVVGRSIVPEAKVVQTPEELIAEMDKAGIDQALIWHIAQHDTFPVEGNRLACEFVEGYDRLLSSWTAMPPSTEEITLEELFGSMKDAGIFALRLFPEQHRYLLDAVALSPLVQEAAERKVPIILSMARGIGWQDVYQLLKEVPNLTCILTDIGTWSQNRYFMPLMARYPNVHIETSMLSLLAGGLAYAAKLFGAQRFVYGSGFPDRYFEAPLLDLLHSDLSKEEKKLIASGNILRIKEEVQL